MTESTSEKTEPRVRSELLADRWSGDRSIGSQTSPPIAQLITPTWAEVADARDRHHRDAQRLRRWQWWFVGMFALYTTLVGILLLELAL